MKFAADRFRKARLRTGRALRAASPRWRQLRSYAVGGFVVIEATFRFGRLHFRNLGKGAPLALGRIPWNIEKQRQWRVTPYLALNPEAVENLGCYAEEILIGEQGGGRGLPAGCVYAD